MSFWNRLFDGSIEWKLVAAALVPALLIAWIGAHLARRAAVAAIRGVLRDTLVTSSPLVRAPLRLVSAAAFVLIAGVLILPALEFAGLRPRANAYALTTIVLRVGFILLIAFALIRIIGLIVTRFEHDLSVGTGVDALERAKRARTLGSVISKVATVVISGVALLMILRTFNFDIAPVLTGAGIVGVAVGFGAQTLVRDIIGGFFLILEDQVRVGDVVTINGTGGLVEELNLRTIVLRDIEGTVHVFPNGSITTLANRSKDFSYYVIDLSVSYQDDPDRVAGLLRHIGAELQADTKFGPFILEPIEVLGIDAFAEKSLLLKARIKTMPLKQWEVGRELRRRIRQAFQREGITMMFPDRVIALAQQGTAHERPADEGSVS
jgi:small conductance mechanosensitive channel